MSIRLLIRAPIAIGVGSSPSPDRDREEHKAQHKCWAFLFLICNTVRTYYILNHFQDSIQDTLRTLTLEQHFTKIQTSESLLTMQMIGCFF